MGSCLIIYNVNLNLICHIFRRFTEHRLNLCSYFFNIPVCYTLLSDNVRGISAIKTVSGDMTSFFHFCTDFLPRGKTHSVGVNKAVVFNMWSKIFPTILNRPLTMSPNRGNQLGIEVLQRRMEIEVPDFCQCSVQLMNQVCNFQ